MDYLTETVHTERGKPDVGLESALRMERSAGVQVNMFLTESVSTYVHM